MRNIKKRVLTWFLVLSMLVGTVQPIYADEIGNAAVEESYETLNQVPEESLGQDDLEETVEAEQNETTEETTEEATEEAAQKPMLAKMAVKAADVVTVKINGVEAGAESLQAAIAKSGIAPASVISIEFVSGTITSKDVTYIKSSVTGLTTLKMNLSDGLKYVNHNGVESTVIPAYAFEDMTALGTVEIGGFTEVAAGAFSGCRKLATISMPNVTTIGESSFYNNDAMKEVDLTSVETIKREAFNSCEGLTALDMPNTVTIEDSAFSGCTGVTEINMQKIEKIGMQAFGSIKNTVHVTLGTVTPPVTDKSAFGAVKLGSTVTIPEGSLAKYLPDTEAGKVYDSADYIRWNRLDVMEPGGAVITYNLGGKYLLRYQLVKAGESIGEEPFKMTLNEKVVGDIYEDAAFTTPADGLSSAYKPGAGQKTLYAKMVEKPADVVTVKINGVEAGAESLQAAIAKSGIAPASVISIEFVSGTITSKDVTYIKSSVTGLTTLKMNLSDGLKYVNHNGVESTVIPAYAFEDMTALGTVEIGGFTEVAAGAFSGCRKLATISMPNVTTIGESSFYNNDAMKEVDLTSVETIKREAFNSCEGLTALDMPNTVTIEDSAFSGCTGVTEINMQKIEKIGMQAFGSIKNTVHVTLGTVTPPVTDKSAFGAVKLGSTVTIPEGSLAKYLPDTEAGKVYDSADYIRWNRLDVMEPGGAVITYNLGGKYLLRYQLVKAGESIGEEPFKMTLNEKVVGDIYEDAAFTTPADGLSSAYKPGAGQKTLYAKMVEKPADVVTVKINGVEAGAESLQAAIAKSGIAPASVISIEFVSGTITSKDVTYIKSSVTGLTTLKMNLSDGLKYVNHNGVESTVIPAYAFEDMTALGTVEIGGFTEVAAGAFSGCRKLATISMPNVTTIGESSFYNNDAMKEVDLTSVETIKREAFNSCEGLTALDMPNTVTIEDSAFSGCTGVTEINMQKIEKIGMQAFGSIKNTVHVTLGTVTPPVTDKSAFGAVKLGSTVTIPEGSLAKYLPDTEAGKVYDSADYIRWNRLDVMEPGGAVITYNLGGKYLLRYQLVKAGESIGEEPFKMTLNEKVVGDIYEDAAFTTPADGLSSAYKPGAGQKTLYAKMVEKPADVVTVKINGVEAGAESLQAAIAKSGIAPASVISIEFVSGTITSKDVTYIKSSVTGLTTLKMNLSDGLKYVNHNGVESTVIPAYAFEDMTALGTVEIGGFTEVAAGAFSGCRKLATISMPNVTTIGESSFYNNDAMKEVDLTSVETIKREAFNSCEGLTALDMPNTVTIEDSAFSGCTGVTEINMQKIEKIGMQAFGSIKNTVHVTLGTVTPPVTDKSAFGAVKLGSTVTIPEGSLAKYLPDTEAGKVYDSADYIRWNRLDVMEPGGAVITYNLGGKYLLRYQLVKAGESIGEEPFKMTLNEKVVGDIYEDAAFTTPADGLSSAYKPGAGQKTLYAKMVEEKTVTFVIDGKETEVKVLKDQILGDKMPKDPSKTGYDFTGWNTEADGTGEAVTKDTVITEDIKIYATFKKQEYSITISGSDNVEIDPSGEIKAEYGEDLTISFNPKDGYTIEKVVIDGKEYTGKELEDLNGKYTFEDVNGAHEISFETEKLYTVTVDVDGKKTEIPVKESEGKLGDKMPKDPSKTGYDFAGWNTKADGTGEAVTKDTEITEDTTIYATFKKQEYSITISGGDNVEIDPSGKIKVEYGEDITISFNPKDGYTIDKVIIDGKEYTGKELEELNGKYTFEDVNGAHEISFETEKEEVPPVEKDKVTVSFDVDGKKTEVEIIEGEAIGEKLPKAPEKAGYDFIGWNTKADGTGETVTADTVADKDMTVYAVFKENKAEESVAAEIDSVKAENGKITITLKEKPTKAPTVEDIKAMIDLNGKGDKDLAITGFTYDGDKTITLTFNKIVQTDKKQTFTVTITMNGKAVKSNVITVAAKGDGDKTDDNKGTPATGDTAPVGALAAIMLLSVSALVLGKKKRA